MKNPVRKPDSAWSGDGIPSGPDKSPATINIPAPIAGSVLIRSEIARALARMGNHIHGYIIESQIPEYLLMIKMTRYDGPVGSFARSWYKKSK